MKNASNASKYRRRLFPTMGSRDEKRLFSSFNDAPSLAKHLGVPVKALYCVELEKETSCAVPECLYLAVVRNSTRGNNSGPRCCLHHTKWFPREPNRGHYLIGTSYLRSKNGTNHTCCCENSYCNGIGYSSSMMRIPKQYRKLASDALGASGKLAATLIDEKKDVRLAPWHFHPAHRIQKSDGRWTLIHFGDDDVFRDNENKRWVGYPPPNYSPKDYYEIECHAGGGRMRPQDRWRSTLPAWVRRCVQTERSADQLAPGPRPKRPPLATLSTERLSRRSPKRVSFDANKQLASELGSVRKKERLLTAQLSQANQRAKESDAAVGG